MITEKFTPTEMRLLRRRLEQYGTIKDCAQKTGVHRTTIARILKTGECTALVAGKLREYLGSEKENNKSTTEHTESVLLVED